MSRSTDLFPTADADAKVQEIKGWLKSKGVGDFDAVSLFCDQLDKVHS
jgi:5'-3' exoribonuclease 1